MKAIHLTLTFFSQPGLFLSWSGGTDSKCKYCSLLYNE